jgi:hypothetical protein
LIAFCAAAAAGQHWPVQAQLLIKLMKEVPQLQLR